MNPRQLQATTDATGHATFTYTGTVAGGNDIVQANATITGMAAYSNMVTVPWNTGTNQAPVVSGGSALTVTLPQTAVISGSVIDDGLPAGSTLAISWSTVSGPGTVTFSNPNQPVTAAAFSAAGVYVLRLTASDTQYTATSDVTVTANSGTAVSQGWISGVTDHGTINGIVPISVVAGVTLQSGTLSYWPVSNQSAVTMLKQQHARHRNAGGAGHDAAGQRVVLDPAGRHQHEQCAPEQYRDDHGRG